MREERKKPTAGFWITVALVVVLVGYPLSYGPGVWISVKLGSPDWFTGTVGQLYVPLDIAVDHGPEWLGQLWFVYTAWWVQAAGGQLEIGEPVE